MIKVIELDFKTIFLSKFIFYFELDGKKTSFLSNKMVKRCNFYQKKIVLKSCLVSFLWEVIFIAIEPALVTEIFNPVSCWCSSSGKKPLLPTFKINNIQLVISWFLDVLKKSKNVAAL